MVSPISTPQISAPAQVYASKRIGGRISDIIDKVATELTRSDSGRTDYRLAAAQVAAEMLEIPPGSVQTDEQATQVLQSVLFFCLNGHHYHDASVLLWPPNLFTCLPEATRRVWDALDSSAGLIVMGGASMSKTYGGGVYYFLDWLADPEYTTIKVLGPSEQHLQDNLFSHLVELHRASRIPLPGRVGDLFIGLDLRQRRSSISGVVVPLGKRPSGRLQGAKRFPRRRPHPTFGKLSRMRILLDEAENIPQGIWSDIDNVIANSEGVDGLKIACAYNPKDSSLPLGQRAEPVGGWRVFDIERDYDWVSARGWRVVRLDGERCENVVQKRIVFPGLQSCEGLELLARSSGGKSSASYFTFGRGCYPQKGAAFTVIPQSVLNRVVAEVVWLETPTKASGVDLALEGGDLTVHVGGLYGRATGLKYPRSLEDPDGREETFTDSHGRPAPRWIAQLTEVKVLERGESVAMAREVKRACQEFGTRPEWICVDRTGHGAGVHDILREIWSPLIRGINYSESATSTKILLEDTQTASELYERVVSEVWFATAKWAEHGVLKVHPSVPTSKLFLQLGGRQFKPGLRNKVESKREYRDRTAQPSPDEADAVTLFVHSIRLNVRETPSALPTLATASPLYRRPVVRNDCTAKHDSLD